MRVAVIRDLVLRLAWNFPLLCHLLAVLAHTFAGGAIFYTGYVELDVGKLDACKRVESLTKTARLHHAAQPVGHSLREPDLHLAHRFHTADHRQWRVIGEHPRRFKHADHRR